jgi:hypothetical protein
MENDPDFLAMQSARAALQGRETLQLEHTLRSHSWGILRRIRRRLYPQNPAQKGNLRGEIADGAFYAKITIEFVGRDLLEQAANYDPDLLVDSIALLSGKDAWDIGVKTVFIDQEPIEGSNDIWKRIAESVTFMIDPAKTVRSAPFITENITSRPVLNNSDQLKDMLKKIREWDFIANTKLVTFGPVAAAYNHPLHDQIGIHIEADELNELGRVIGNNRFPIFACLYYIIGILSVFWPQKIPPRSLILERLFHAAHLPRNGKDESF